MVASHRSAQIGRKGRGRMFLPAVNPNQLDQSKGQFTAASVTAAAAAQKALLEALTYSPVGPTDGHTHAIITGKPFTQYGKIDTVMIGAVPDTQRRRRKSLAQTYTSVPVAP